MGKREESNNTIQIKEDPMLELSLFLLRVCLIPVYIIQTVRRVYVHLLSWKKQ